MTNKQKKRILSALSLMICAAGVTTATIGTVSVVGAAESQSEDTAEHSGEQPPEMPDGEGGSGGPGGEAPDGEAPDGNGAPGGGGGADTMNYDYDGDMSGTLTADGEETESNGETIASDTADVNAALAENGGTLKIENGTLTKSGDDTDGDNCNFYGINSILLSVGEESKAYISESSLSADSDGSNAIFATDSGTVYADDITISTTADNSRGLDATYGGTIIANDVEITTQGDHCAAVATDRGGGDISVTSGTFSTAGSGSPLLYSTGNIQVNGITGTASGSQIAGMEGLNTILISDSTLESTITEATASDPVANGIIIYQSTSGDAEAATGDTATFQAVDSTLKSAVESGSMFYLTNTSADILLQNTTLDFDSDSVNLLQIEGNDSNNWGTAGSNGADVNFTAREETISGNIQVDTISSLNMYLLDNTTYTGAVSLAENSVNTDVTDEPISITVDETSQWIVTGDSTVTNLNNAGSIVDEDGKTVTIVADGETVVSGDSAYTITVTGSYSTTADTDDAAQASEDLIDRSDFDSYFGTETVYTMTGSEEKTSEQQEEAEEKTAETVTEEAEKTFLVMVYDEIIALTK